VTNAMTRKALAMLALLLACVAAIPADAHASVIDDIIVDCQDGELQGNYTPAQLRKARQDLPGDVAQYTDCAAVLRNAEIPDRPGQSAGTGTGATGTNSSTDGLGGSLDREQATTPGDAITLAEAMKANEQPVTADPVDPVNPNSLRPTAAVRLDRSGNVLPTSLVVVLAGLGVGLLVAGAPGARRALRRLRPAP
jgi:hypothetical protein